MIPECQLVEREREAREVAERALEVVRCKNIVFDRVRT